MGAIHQKLAAGKWHMLSLAEQMGNIGSEVHRVRKWREKGDEKRCRQAFERMLELLDLTISDPRWISGRKELARVREVLCDAYSGGNEYGSSWRDLDAYFTQFALLARR